MDKVAKVVGDLKLVGNTVIGDKQFDMSYSDGAVQKAHYGIADDYYGGMLKEFRKVKGYDGIMLCLDKRDNVINLAYVESELSNVSRVLLGFEPIEEPLVDEQPLSTFEHPPTGYAESPYALSAESLLKNIPAFDAVEDAKNTLSVDDAVSEIINAKAARKR
jgi:hypothetical protein